MAMRLGEVSLISPFRFIRVVFGVGVAVLIRESVERVIIGAAMVVGAGLYSPLRERSWPCARRRHRSAAPLALAAFPQTGAQTLLGFFAAVVEGPEPPVQRQDPVRVVTLEVLVMKIVGVGVRIEAARAAARTRSKPRCPGAGLRPAAPDLA